MTTRTVSIPTGSTSRIDALVSAELGLSRTRVQALIAQGRVRVDGRVPRKSEIFRDGAEIAVDLPPPERVDIEPEDLPLAIVHEDDALCVVDKPAGMVTHPAPGHSSGTMVNALMHLVPVLSGVGGRLRPGIVHRLDRDTSGLLVVAKNDTAHHALQRSLAQREIVRRYLAATWGRIPSSRMEIDAPIGRHPKDRKRMAVVEGGRVALTLPRVLESWRCAELLEVELKTGRTHQIRVHLAHIGHPVVGDDTYGEGWERGVGGPHLRWSAELARRTPRQFLHASELGFRHPETGNTMRFRSELPDDLAGVRRWALSGGGRDGLTHGAEAVMLRHAEKGP